MSIFGAGADVVGKVVTKYEADVKEHVAELKKLRGEQRKQAQDAIDGLEKQNKAWNDHKVRAGIALAGVAASVVIAKASFDEFKRTAELSAGAASISVDRLKVAAGGLKTQMELLTLAQAGARGAFHLNTVEMETVVKGMRALEAQGFKTEEVTNKITKAIQEGAVSQLEEFGIKLQSTGTIAGDKQLVLEALAAEIKEVGGNYAKAGDDVSRAGVMWSDTLHSVKLAIGSLVVSMGPMIESLGKAVGLIGSLADLVGKLPGLGGGGGNGDGKLPADYGITAPESVGTTTGKVMWAPGFALFDMLDQAVNGDGGAMDRRTMAHLAPESSNTAIYNPNSWLVRQALEEKKKREDATLSRWRARMQEQLDKQRRTALEFRDRTGIGKLGTWLNQAGMGLGFIESNRAKPTRGRDEEEFFLDYAQGSDTPEGGYRTDIDMSEPKNQYVWATSHSNRLKEIGASIRAGGEQNDAQTQREKMLEGIFGPVSEFEAYATGFQLLETAASSAFEAWMTGSKGVAAAMKEAVAGFAKGLAHEALLQAMRHTAHGIGMLAFPDPLAKVSAAQHFKAAAIWGGVAIAAGGAARALGGGSGGGASAGGYSARGGLASGGGGGSRNVTIVLGGSADGESPRSNSRRVARALAVAEQHGYSARPPGVEFS